MCVCGEKETGLYCIVSIANHFTFFFLFVECVTLRLIMHIWAVNSYYLFGNIPRPTHNEFGCIASEC